MVKWGVTPSSKSWVIEHDALFRHERKKKLNENNREVVRTFTPIDPTPNCPKEKATMGNNENEKATVEKGMDVAHWKVFLLSSSLI